MVWESNTRFYRCVFVKIYLFRFHCFLSNFVIRRRWAMIQCYYVRTATGSNCLQSWWVVSLYQLANQLFVYLAFHQFSTLLLCFKTWLIHRKKPKTCTITLGHNPCGHNPKTITQTALFRIRCSKGLFLKFPRQVLCMFALLFVTISLISL